MWASPRSRPEMAAISSSVSSKSKTSRFSAIRPRVGGLRDGHQSQLHVPAQHRLGGRLAVAGRDLADRRIGPQPASEAPIGLQDSVTMPCSASKARVSARVLYGLSWIWFTSGTMSVSSSTRCRWVGLKFETPIAADVARLEQAAQTPQGVDVAILIGIRPVHHQQVE